MDWAKRLFDLSGRAGRKTYWLTIIPVTLVLFTCVGLLVEEGQGIPLWATLAAIGVTLAMLPVIFAVSVRRLHDRNKAWWWMLLYWVVPMLFGPSADGQDALIPGLPPAINATLSLVSAGVSIWSLIELGFLKGAAGYNRFGPDPAGRGTAEVFS